MKRVFYYFSEQKILYPEPALSDVLRRARQLALNSGINGKCIKIKQLQKLKKIIFITLSLKVEFHQIMN